MTIWRISPDVPRLERLSLVERSNDPPCDIGRLRSALDAIPNEGQQELDYDQWRDVIFGIHSASNGSDEGLALANAFSAKSSKHDEQFLFKRVWPYISSNRAGSTVTGRTIFHLAGQHGWIEPETLDAFDNGRAAVEALGVQADSTALARYAFQNYESFTTGPELDYLVDGVLPRAALVVLYGASTAGKTFLAIDLVGAIIRGVEWRDRRVTAGRVGYIVAEGAGGFRNRLRAYVKHNELDGLDIGVLADAPNFGNAKDVKDVISAMSAWGALDLVVVDTLAQVMNGDENSSEDMGKALTNCRAIHKATGATVMLIHHSGKDEAKGARGHSSLKAAADAEIEITRVDMERIVTVRKMKDGEDNIDFGVKLLTVPVGVNKHGGVVESCVIQHVVTVPRAQRRRPLAGENQRLVFQYCKALISADGVPALESEVSLEMDKIINPPGQRRRSDAVNRTIDSVVDSGWIVRDGIHLVVAEL